MIPEGMPPGGKPPLAPLSGPEISKHVPKPLEWVVEGLVSAGRLTVVASQAGSGKSFAGLQASLQVAGSAEQGFQTAVRAPVLYIDGEMGLDQIHHRMTGLGEHPLPPNLHLLDTSVDGLDITVADDRQRIIETTQQLGCKMVVFDTLSEFHRKDENVSGDMQPVMAGFRAVAHETGAGVLILHHVGHSGTGSRGSSVILDKPDLVLHMHVVTDEDGVAPEIIQIDTSGRSKVRFTSADLVTHTFTRGAGGRLVPALDHSGSASQLKATIKFQETYDIGERVASQRKAFEYAGIPKSVKNRAIFDKLFDVHPEGGFFYTGGTHWDDGPSI